MFFVNLEQFLSVTCAINRWNVHWPFPIRCQIWCLWFGYVAMLSPSIVTLHMTKKKDQYWDEAWSTHYNIRESFYLDRKRFIIVLRSFLGRTRSILLASRYILHICTNLKCEFNVNRFTFENCRCSEFLYLNDYKNSDTFNGLLRGLFI